jgi:cytochrome c-type biogenesis protein CcmE
MSRKLDAELAEAAKVLDDTGEPDESPASGDAGAHEAGRSPGGATTPASAKRRNVGLLVVLLAIVVGTVTLFLFGFKAASVYAMPIDELLGRKGELLGRRVTIDGELVPGSLIKQTKPCEYRFKVTSKGSELEVRFPQCVVPQNFVDRPEGGVSVTSEGTLKPEGYFEAATIMAKCSSRYDPATRTMKKDG